MFWEARRHTFACPSILSAVFVTARLPFHRHPSIRSLSFSFLCLRACTDQHSRHISTRSFLCGADAPQSPRRLSDQVLKLITLLKYPSCAVMTARMEDPAGFPLLLSSTYVGYDSFDGEDDPRHVRMTKPCEGLEMPARFRPRIQFFRRRALDCLLISSTASVFPTSCGISVPTFG